METHVLVTFSNFSLSSNDITNPIQMELFYESKKIKFIYPQSEPLKLNFSSKFIQDKVSLLLTTTIEGHNKKKLSYRADVTLNKTIFSDNSNSKTIYEKNITMIPIESMKELKDMKDNKRIGKIFMQIQLLDPVEEWKKNFKNFNKKKTGAKLKNSNISNNDSMSNQKKDHLNNVNNSNATTNNKQSTSPKQKETISENMPDPALDEVSDDSKAMDELNKFINLDEINKLRDLVKNNYKNIFPNDINALKSLNENLYQNYNQLNAKYNELLNEMNNTNENIRNKAIEYYNEYKDLKKVYDKKLNELNKRKKNNDNEFLKNKQENDNLKNNLQKYYYEKDYLLQKLSSPPPQPATQPAKAAENQKNEEKSVTAQMNNNDMKMIKDALKKMSSLGYDILDGLILSEEEKQLLTSLLSENADNNANNGNAKEDLDDKNNKKEEELEGTDRNDIEADKEDYDLSNQIVGLIERDVNDLYMRKLIEQVKIDQIDAITYSFKGLKNTKEVEFKIEKGNLVCNTGESFTVWLISNFSL